jgi:hypothetical protein
MNLGEIGEALALDTAFWLEGANNPDHPFEEMGALSLDLAGKFRSLAIICLLAKGNNDLFHHHLMRAGQTWKKYLERVHREEAFDDHHFCSGRYEPLLDAIAAFDLTLARRITQLSPGEFREGHEYEDDYCYAQIIARFLAEPPKEDEIESLLERFVAYLEGQSNARLAISRALTARDQTAFNASFAELLDTRDLEIEALKGRGQLEDPKVVAECRVFVEGLAVLRLAEHRGLRTEQEYRYCPSLARIPLRTPFPCE